ncbi:MAG: ABC transporter ATP-binding protein [Bilifractor sp.]
MFKTLGGCVREYKKDAVLAPVFIAGEAALETAIPLVMARMIDRMTGTSMDPIIHYGVILLILATCSLFCGQQSAKLAATASTGFAKNLRQDMYYKIQDFSFQDIDRFSTSSLITRMTTDVTNVQNAFQMMIRVAFRAPLMLIFALIMCMTISVRISLIFLLMIPVLALVIFLIMRKVIPFFRRIFRKYDKMNASVEENVSGIRVVKAFVREDYEKEKFYRASENVRSDFTKAEKIMALLQPVMMFCIYLVLCLVCVFGAQIIIRTRGSEMTTGELSSLTNYGVQILASLMMVSMVFVMITMAQESGNRISEVLSHQSSLTSPENGKKEVPDGSIVFDHVSFCYREGSGRNALSDINLNIRSGMTVGIIGGTGSSKSTLIQLIPRLYDVTEGAIRVGGTDVREYDLESLRNAVAVVLQKNVVFSGTIRENLLWGDKEATDDEIRHACHLACADEFIDQFPRGYDTMISQGGTNVSGGQKQRLCIARALLKKPKILIMDDSTSAVDTHTDALIRKAMREEIPDTTKITIAQRVSSVEDADLILVMEDGKIVEQGTSAELLALGGIYREIYDSQVNGKEAE